MIERIPASDRYLAAHGWLNSFHLFSFAEYYDPKNTGFGPLRVFNDDFIIGESGFSEHPHQNMEIITIMREGVLTHRDSMGNMKTVSAGEVQTMSAGTGVAHSEVNMGKVPVRLSQIWIEPWQMNLQPTYGQKDFSKLEKNVLTAVASGQEKEGAIGISANVTIYLADFDKGTELSYAIEKDRGVFIYLTEGEMKINEEFFKQGDQARIRQEEKIELTSASAKFVLIDVSLV
jgi:redox-sensitive bicupin YhaK (pirin superfamily)